MAELIIVGDRVLIKPDTGEQQTESGLVLPASVAERDRIGSGRVEQVGPGHLIPNPDYSASEPWTEPKTIGTYLPLEANIGDIAFFQRKEAIEFTYKGTNFLIIPHHAILALVRLDHEDVITELLDQNRL
ncbi:MAG: co-chaperone GroES family protein [Bacteroidetes bacterium]|nr:co-chaperone GroES family protein [Bacteroidota bacterium]MCY4205312.1 co-chaperone GroES family protein [Bacteroidota bacterium]